MTKTDEQKIRHIMTDRRLDSIKSMLGKKHAIDFILLLHIGKADHKDAEPFLIGLGFSFSDNAYYSRMTELVRLGLAFTEPIDAHRKRFKLTRFGERMAKLLLGFFARL